MKTAMQELIDELESINSYPMMPLIIRLMKDKLDKEKEQIIDAYINGYTSYDSEMSGFEYYTQTHNKNK